VVNKLREIYFVGNVKIHLDRIRTLGEFVEVERFPAPPASTKCGRKRASFSASSGSLPRISLANLTPT